MENQRNVNNHQNSSQSLDLCSPRRLLCFHMDKCDCHSGWAMQSLDITGSLFSKWNSDQIFTLEFLGLLHRIQ